MEVKGIRLEIGYHGQIVLPSFDITVNKGEITTIIGPNGSGKSTLLKAITRLLPCSSGIVSLDGKDIRKLPSSLLARHLGVLPQYHSAPSDFKVRDLVSYGRVPYQKWYENNTKYDEAVIDWALQITRTWELQNKSIHACSGGEAQRVWIATVLAQQPEILFLDEPTTYLDIAHQRETMRLVRKLNRESDIGVVMVLHDLEQAMEVSDRLIVMKDGKKYAEGTPCEVITSQMLSEVYQVKGEIIRIPGRKKPLLVLEEIN